MSKKHQEWKREHVLLKDPSGNIKRVSCKNGPREQIVRAKLAAGWSLHYPIDDVEIEVEDLAEEPAE